jgi:hypothetical protein
MTPISAATGGASATSVQFMELFTDDTLIAAGEAVTSEWLDFQALNVDTMLMTRSSTSNAYVLEVDWSSTGTTADVTEVVLVANDTSVTKTIAARYGRVRVRNADAGVAFTSHRTVVTGRSH